MKKYIDLTLPIVPHWRCIQPDEIIEKCSTANGDPASVTRFPRPPVRRRQDPQ